MHDFSLPVSAEGNVWFSVGLPERYFDRFFDAGFHSISILTRTSNLQQNEIPGPGWLESANPNVTVAHPFLSGYSSIFKPLNAIRIFCEMKNADLIVVNYPSIIGSFVLMANLFLRKKYSIEVAGDETMWNSKAGGSIVGLFLRFMMPFFIKRANGAAYVTKYLNRKYPNALSTIVASNVDLTRYSQRCPLIDPLVKKSSISLGFVGGLTARKGLACLLKALAICNERGLSHVKLYLVGGHADVDWLELVGQTGLAECVTFCGVCGADEVFSYNKSFDIYVQPSVSEGLPRATIEAMGCGTPVIASNLPGFLELLDKDDCFDVNNSVQLANLILRLANDVTLYNFKASRNFEKSKEFDYHVLGRLRAEFYRSMID